MNEKLSSGKEQNFIINNCRRCGSSIVEGQKFCTKCGFEPLNGVDYCQQCGAKTKEGQEFCTKCGFKILANKAKENNIERTQQTIKKVKTKTNKKPIIIVITIIIIAILGFGSLYHMSLFTGKSINEATTSSKIQSIDFEYNPNLKIKNAEMFNEVTSQDGYLFETDFYPDENDINYYSSKYILDLINYMNGYDKDYFEANYEDAIVSKAIMLNLKYNCVEHKNLELGGIVHDGNIYKTIAHEKINVIESGKTEEIDYYFILECRRLEMDYTLIDQTVSTSTENVYWDENEKKDTKDGIQFIPYNLAANYRDYHANINSPKSLNNVGMDYYHDSHLKLAAALFYRATILDGYSEEVDSIALANYNLACVISLLSESNEKYDNLEECLAYLERSFQLRADRWARSLEDSDLDNIRGTVQFKNLIEQYRK